MFRFVPPAGVPVELTQILRAFRISLGPNGDLENGLQSLASYLKVRYVLASSSGRAGLCLILKGLHRLRPERCVVAVPAYTCFSVPASVVRAGLRLFPVDIDPETLDFDFPQLEALPSDNLLCIVTSNLFGFVNDGARIEGLGRAKGAFVVDDAAQALGASRNGRLAGTFGDVGLHSLGRGKVLGAAEGGLIVTDSEEIRRMIQEQAGELPSPSFTQTARLFLELLTQSVFLRPRLYWIPNSLPFLKLGVTEYAPDFPIRRLSGFAGALVLQLMNCFLELNRVRREHAKALTEALRDNPFLTTPKPALGSVPTYIRFPVVARDDLTRDRALTRLRAAGIGATRYYPSAICDIPGIARHITTDDYHCSQAEAVSRRLFTLPTHGFVRGHDLARMIGILNG